MSTHQDYTHTLLLDYSPGEARTKNVTTPHTSHGGTHTYTHTLEEEIQHDPTCAGPRWKKKTSDAPSHKESEKKKRSRGKAGIPWDRLRTKDLTGSLKWERSEWEKDEEEEVKEARKEVGGGGRARG